MQCLPGLTGLSISPANSTLAITSDPAPIQFTATGSFASGARDITGQLAWSVSRSDDTPPGTVSGGLYHPFTGGIVTISATDGCKSGQTDATLQLSATFNDPGPGTTDRFDAGTNGVTTGGANVPFLVYPNDQTRFPRNIYKVLFQWKKNGDDFFKLTFAGPNSTTTVWTDGNGADCSGIANAGCWLADQQTWTAIASSNAGELSTITLDGVVTGDANVYEAPQIQIGFSKKDVRGAIFYWSTTAIGVRRASVSDALPEPYVVAKPLPTQLPDGTTVQCVGCHTLSRDGQLMVAGTQTSNATGMFVYNVTPTPPPNDFITNQLSTTLKGYGAFSPDDSQLVVTAGNVLEVFATDGGALVGTLAPTAATSPDWSPADSMIAYADRSGEAPSNANLATLAHLPDGGWAASGKIIVPSSVPDAGSNLFPSFSPDGHWIAYSHGKGGQGDLTALLYLVDADGGTPIELARANHLINNTPALSSGQFEANMPTWAPSGDYEWVAFSSARPYGLITSAGAAQQIWVAAIDPAKLGTGQDPSFPAFRFAFQALNENNHRAFWSQDVRGLPDAGSF